MSNENKVPHPPGENWTEDDYHEACGGSVEESTGSAEPTKEEREEMAAEQDRLDAEANLDEAVEAEREELNTRSKERVVVPGSYDQPFKCEDDLPAPIFATIQTALAGRSTLTESQRIDLIEHLKSHGLALNRIEFPHPTAPHYLLHIVSSLPRPTTGCYIY